MTGTAKGGAGPNGGRTRSYKEGAVLPPAGTTAGSVQAPDAVSREFGSSDRVVAKTPPPSLDCMGVTDDRTASAPVPVPGRGQPGHSLPPHAYPPS